MPLTTVDDRPAGECVAGFFGYSGGKFPQLDIQRRIEHSTAALEIKRPSKRRGPRLDGGDQHSVAPAFKDGAFEACSWRRRAPAEPSPLRLKDVFSRTLCLFAQNLCPHFAPSPVTGAPSPVIRAPSPPREAAASPDAICTLSPRRRSASDAVCGTR